MNVSRARLAVAALALALAFVAPPAVAQLADVDARPTGFLTAATGGMQADAWGGTSMATAKRLVSAIPAAPRSRALRDLQFKVLVSELTPPPPDGSPPPSLFVRKVDKLAAMGEGESLNEMVRNAGGYADPAVAATVVNALMLAGERQGACAVVNQWPLPAPFGSRAQAACRMLQGDLAAASAAAAPAGHVDGPALMAIGLAQGPVPAALLRSTEPPIIRALIGLKSLPITTRLEIGERGEALAIIEAARLGDLYLEALRDGVVLPPAMARRARMVAAARNASNPDEVVSAIIAAYGEARGSPLFPTVARASTASLISLPPKPQYANIAQEAMRGFLLLGDKQQTQAWTRLALGAVTSNARAIIALDRLMPLVVVAGVANPDRITPETLNRWYELAREEDAAKAPLRGYLLLQLLRATGVGVAARSTDLPEAPPGGSRLVMPASANLQAMTASAATARRAETALLASICAAETPLAQLHPAGVAAIVQALRQAGEDNAARLLAIEVAIAYGL